MAYLEIGKGVCRNLRRGADTPGAPVLMIDIRAACDTIHSIPDLTTPSLMSPERQGVLFDR